ncbi:MAG: DUF433 domain-containing protein [Planctomycetaceae bacterium]|nr:DUF433 domain-containing protein [Planctomycetaceae bacterium]
MSSVSTPHIEATPGVCGGKSRVAGTRIRVADIVTWHDRQGMSPAEIVADFPQLTLADVHAALVYYFDHRLEIEQQFADAEAFASELQRQIPSKLKRRMPDVRDDSVSSG